jgi:anti-sigma regulatory factor (Ser/Thr protein kinase)
MDPDSTPMQGDSQSSDGVGRFARRERHLKAMNPRPANDCDIRLTLPARAENVAVVRHVIGALAEALAMPPRMVEDIRLAVTEACTNVVRHAYRGHEGPLEVMIRPEAEGNCLNVVVSDRGSGIVPNPASEGPGLGLPLIAALTDGLEIDHAPDRGSRLAMSFRAGQTVEAA